VALDQTRAILELPTADQPEPEDPSTIQREAIARARVARERAEAALIRAQAALVRAEAAQIRAEKLHIDKN
jgi:hypothetical protein